MIWVAGGAGPVRLRINLPLSTGVITLTATDAQNNAIEVQRTNPVQEPEGDAEFEVNITQNTFLFLQVLNTFTTAAKSDVFVSVRRNGSMLKCVNNQGKVLNKDGGGYKAHSAGKVAIGSVLAKAFTVKA